MAKALARIALLGLILMLLMGATALAAEEPAALLQGYAELLAQEPDMELQIVFAGTFDFADGPQSMSTTARSRFTHDPMAYDMEFSYETFSSGQQGRMVAMLHDGVYVMYAYDDDPQGNRLKREVTQDVLRGTVGIPPVLVGISETALAHADAATLDPDGATLRVSLTPQEVAQFLAENELALGNITLEVTAQEPVDLVLTFDADTRQITGISLDCPVMFAYSGEKQAGSISLEITLYRIGEVDPVVMPDHAKDVPFS